MAPIQPSLEWYASVSERKQMPTRCPYANVHRCPRYFESVSLLAQQGIASKLAPDTHDALLAKWRAHELWPVSGETAVSVSGRNPPNAFSNFCPEVSFNTFKWFASGLIGFYDEEESDARHRTLSIEGDCQPGDWRWNWDHLAPLHYSDCPLYALLQREQHAVASGSEPPANRYSSESQGLRDSDADIARICTRLPLLIRQLRQRHGGRETLDVNDEYDLQDLVHSILRLYFDDIRPEEYVPSYAGRASRMDFLLKNESCAIETKMTRKGLESRQVGEQLIVDFERYREHPRCKKLYCLVYDPEHRIDNPRGLESDLSGKRDGLDVRVIIVPQGT